MEIPSCANYLKGLNPMRKHVNRCTIEFNLGKSRKNRKKKRNNYTINIRKAGKNRMVGSKLLEKEDDFRREILL